MKSIIMTILMPSKKTAQVLELILVTGILAFVYLTNIDKVEFHPDESQWIGTSYIFENYVRFEFKSEAWDTYYATTTQPPMANYIMGAGRFIGGYTIGGMAVNRGTWLRNAGPLLTMVALLMAATASALKPLGET